MTKVSKITSIKGTCKEGCLIKSIGIPYIRTLSVGDLSEYLRDIGGDKVLVKEAYGMRKEDGETFALFDDIESGITYILTVNGEIIDVIYYGVD